VETDEIDSTLADLRRDLTRERDERRLLQRKLDDLTNKLRYPGTKFLIDLEYALVYDDTIAVGALSLHVEPPFETLQGLLHSVYEPSAYCPTSNTPVVVTNGSLIVAPADAISVAIHRQRQTGPTRIDASVAIYNASASPIEIAVRVWRRLGMGGAGS
jgi:hypothetical protein